MAYSMPPMPTPPMNSSVEAQRSRPGAGMPRPVPQPGQPQSLTLIPVAPPGNPQRFLNAARAPPSTGVAHGLETTASSFATAPISPVPINGTRTPSLLSPPGAAREASLPLGKYRVRTKAGVTSELAGEEVVRDVQVGALVEIVEIQRVEETGRVRGRLAEGGWISLRDAEGRYTWAEPEAGGLAAPTPDPSSYAPSRITSRPTSGRSDQSSRYGHTKEQRAMGQGAPVMGQGVPLAGQGVPVYAPQPTSTMFTATGTMPMSPASRSRGASREPSPSRAALHQGQYHQVPHSAVAYSMPPPSSGLTMTIPPGGNGAVVSMPVSPPRTESPGRHPYSPGQSPIRQRHGTPSRDVVMTHQVPQKIIKEPWAPDTADPDQADTERNERTWLQRERHHFREAPPAEGWRTDDVTAPAMIASPLVGFLVAMLI